MGYQTILRFDIGPARRFPHKILMALANFPAKRCGAGRIPAYLPTNEVAGAKRIGSPFRPRIVSAPNNRGEGP